MSVQNIKEGIQGKPVSWYSDVFDLIFPNLDKKAANTVWKSKLRKARSSKGAKDQGEAYDRDSEEEDEDDTENTMT